MDSPFCSLDVQAASVQNAHRDYTMTTVTTSAASWNGALFRVSEKMHHLLPVDVKCIRNQGVHAVGGHKVLRQGVGHIVQLCGVAHPLGALCE